MSTRGILNLMFVCLIAVCLIGCGGTSSTPQGVNQPDPVQQEIEKKVQAKGAQEIPPGYMMNSGGELVPTEEKSDSDQP